MYEEGHGVSKDKIAAIMWFILAQDTGGLDFKRELHANITLSGFSFYRRPSEKDQQEAQRRADAWREHHACR